MQEAIIGLIGVAFGGIIGVASTIIQQRFAHSRWEREIKLEYLKDKQKRLQEAWKQAMVKFSQKISSGTLPEDVVIEITMLAPEPVHEAFIKALKDIKDGKCDWPQAQGELIAVMGMTLNNIDNEILKLLS